MRNDGQIVYLPSAVEKTPNGKIQSSIWCLMAKKMMAKFVVDLLKPSSLALLNSFFTSYSTVGLKMKKKMKKTDFKTHFFAPVRGRPIFSVDSRFLGPRNRQNLGKISEKSGPIFYGDFLKKNRDIKKIAIFRMLATLLKSIKFNNSNHNFSS